MVTSEGCPACDDLRPAFEEVEEIHADDSLKFQVLEHSKAPAFKIARLGIDSQFPWVVLKRNGRERDVVDKQKGAHSTSDDRGHARNVAALEHMLARNGLIDRNPEELLFEGGYAKDSSYIGANFVAHDMKDTDFRGKNLRGACLSGSDFREADFQHANLGDAVLSHTNLKGARLDGTDLTDVWWNDTVCPDGTTSSEHDGTCRGHLRRSRHRRWR